MPEMEASEDRRMCDLDDFLVKYYRKNDLDREDLLRQDFSEKSLEELKEQIEYFISISEFDSSKETKRKIGRAVALITKNHPYPVKEFNEYSEYNQDFLRMRKSDLLIGLPSAALFSMIFFIIGGGYVGINFGLFVGIIVLFFLTSVVAKNRSEFEDQELLSCYPEEAYEFGNPYAHSIENTPLKQFAASRNEQLDSIDDTAADMTTMNSKLENARADHQSAVERIASYELDISKAIAYPAFNDVTTPEVSVMLKQLRQCQRLRDDISVEEQSEQGTSADAVRSYADNVDILWVDVHKAEKAAQKIAWSGVSDSEQKDLKAAQQLIVQANDAGNTEDMRANLFQQLKKVIDRLNSHHNVVPARIVSEIEGKAALLLEKQHS